MISRLRSDVSNPKCLVPPFCKLTNILLASPGISWSHAVFYMDDNSDLDFFYILHTSIQYVAYLKLSIYFQSYLSTNTKWKLTRILTKNWWNANSMYISIFYNCHNINYLHSKYKLIEKRSENLLSRIHSDKVYGHISLLLTFIIWRNFSFKKIAMNARDS